MGRCMRRLLLLLLRGAWADHDPTSISTSSHSYPKSSSCSTLIYRYISARTDGKTSRTRSRPHAQTFVHIQRYTPMMKAERILQYSNPEIPRHSAPERQQCLRAVLRTRRT